MYHLFSTKTSQSSKYTKTTAESDPVVVTVVDKTFELKQTTLTKFDINFNGGVADVSKDDVTVDMVGVGAGGKTYSYDVLVKSVTMSKDKMTATVETYLPLEGNETYEVTVKGYETASMVASDGDVVDVKVGVKDSVSYAVNIGKKDFLQYSLIDGNMVDVSRGTTNEKNKVVFNIKYYGKNGTNYELAYYALNANLFEFNEVGDYAVITVTYNTGKLDASNNLITVTSEPTTFYAVAKQDVTVTGITGYATKAAENENWYNYGSANKGLVKDTKNTTLKFTISLADGSTQDIENQNQIIYDKEGMQHGWIYVESVDEDVVDVHDAAGALVVSPRKEGSALLMVYHKTRLSNGIVVTSPVGTIPLTVKGKPVLTNISLDYGGNSKTVTLSIDAFDDDLETAGAGVRTLDQYGVEIGTANYELKGATQEAEAIRTSGGISYNNGTISVDSAAFKAAIMAQTANQLVSNGQYIYTLKFQCGVSWAWKSATIVVDIRGLAKGANNAVIKNEAIDCGWFDTNIARRNNYNENGTKSAEFKVYYMNNGAKYQKIQMSKFSSDISISTATPGYYFKVYKNGADITHKVNGTDITFDNNNGVTLTFSKTKTHVSGLTIVNYDDMGAGAYDLVVYYIGQSRYAGSSAVTPVQVSTEVARMQKVVTCDAGAYSLLSRNSVNIAGNASDSLSILKCFSFKARNGSIFDPYSGDNTANQAKFGNDLIKYYVETDPLLTTADSIYVKNITFFEPVGSNVYAAYTVPIGYYININVPQ